MSEEKLRPCPFCGGFPGEIREEGWPLAIHHKCYSVDLPHIWTEEWNNAYAWKELDEARAVVAELVSTLEAVDSDYGDTFGEITEDGIQKALARGQAFLKGER